MRLTHLEESLLEDARDGKLDIGLGRAAFIASGVQSEAEVDRFVGKVDRLCDEIVAELALAESEEVEKAKAIFDWLWEKKPDRYQSGGSFRLTDVVDAQLSEKPGAVGNCLGLTILYNVLGQRFGLNLKAAHLDHVWGRGPHDLSVLYTKAGTVDIENISKYGFNCQDYLNNPQRKEWGDIELVADIYNSRGNSEGDDENFEKRDLLLYIAR